jgi:hypothetical protein
MGGEISNGVFDKGNAQGVFTMSMTGKFTAVCTALLLVLFAAGRASGQVVCEEPIVDDAGRNCYVVVIKVPLAGNVEYLAYPNGRAAEEMIQILMDMVRSREATIKKNPSLASKVKDYMRRRNIRVMLNFDYGLANIRKTNPESFDLVEFQ